jgi:hypothetical protein
MTGCKPWEIGADDAEIGPGARAVPLNLLLH